MPGKHAVPDKDTVILIEVAGTNIHWMQPGDIDAGNLNRFRSLTSTPLDGFHIVFADYAIWYMSSETPRELIARFFTIDGSRRHDRDDVLAKYRVHR
jgi:hypothetical protein